MTKLDAEQFAVLSRLNMALAAAADYGVLNALETKHAGSVYDVCHAVADLLLREGGVLPTAGGVSP